MMVFYFACYKAIPPPRSGAPPLSPAETIHPANNPPAQPDYGSRSDRDGGSHWGCLLPPNLEHSRTLFPLGPICGLTWLSPEYCVESGPTCRRLQTKQHFPVGVSHSLLGPFRKNGCPSFPSKLQMGSKHLPAQGQPPQVYLLLPQPFLLPSAETPPPNRVWTFALAQIGLFLGETLSPHVRKAGQVTGWAKG